MNGAVKWGLGGLAFAGFVAALTSGGDELDDGDIDDGGDMTTRTQRKVALYAKLGLLKPDFIDEDQRLFVMLVAYGESRYNPKAHNDSPGEVAASRDAWDSNPTLAAKIMARGFTRDQVAIGSGGYGGRLVPYFCDDMLDAKLPVNPRGVFDADLSIVSTIIASHKLQQWRQWRDAGRTVKALRGGFWWPARMDNLPEDRLEKYEDHADHEKFGEGFVDRVLNEFPGPSRGAAMLEALKGTTVA